MSTLDTHWNKPIASLTGLGYLSHVDVGEDSYGPFIECDDGRDHHVIGYTDELRFHVEQGAIADAYLVDGWLTDQACRAVTGTIQKILRESSSLPETYIAALSVDNTSGDEPGIEVAFALPSDLVLTVEQAHNQIMWPFWGTMINITDPGTFGAPYLWAHV